MPIIIDTNNNIIWILIIIFKNQPLTKHLFKQNIIISVYYDGHIRRSSIKSYKICI